MNITLDEIRSKAPNGATHYAETEKETFYLKWINRDMYKAIYRNGSTKFFVDTKQYEIKPL